jgi:hypothetical protein
LADGAFADVEALGNVVHGEGVDGAEEESVDGADGAGVAEEVGEVGEDVNESVGKLRGGRGGVCGGMRKKCRIQSAEWGFTESISRRRGGFNLF